MNISIRSSLSGSALASFEAAVGRQNVSTDQGVLGDYRDPFPFDQRYDLQPAAVVTPASVEEVQAVVRVANEHRVPLWTISRGRNLGYGGGAPRIEGAVLVDLQRLDRILEVNETSGFALVEPGVRFIDLYEHVQNNDLKLWTSVPGLGFGSVIGNAMERGFGYTPYGEHSATHCGLEIVLPDGDLLRTGMGAVSKSTAWNLYRPGFGPAVDGLFSHSNLGIVTKMGIWMMPRPECFRYCYVKFHDHDALGPVIDLLRQLRLEGIIDATTSLSSPIHAAAKMSKHSDWHQGPGAIPHEVIRDKMLPQLGIGWWNLAFGLYGREDIVEARFRVVQKEFAKIPNWEIETQLYPGTVTENEIDPAARIRAGIPNHAALEATKWFGGGGGVLAFAPIAPFTAEDAVKQYKMARKRGDEFGFDYYGSFNGYSRHLNHIYQIFFDRDNEEQTRRLRDCFAVMVKDAAAEGYVEYRAHLSYMDLIAEQFDFNDHALRRFTEKLKDTVDPNGILSPGKQGIWPRASRDPAQT
jgi:4-cresol dehydrogenase (hydroxylating)